MPINKSPESRSPDALNAVIAYIQKLSRNEYFGNVEISFQRGAVTVVRAEQTIRPADLAQWEAPGLIMNNNSSPANSIARQCGASHQPRPTHGRRMRKRSFVPLFRAHRMTPHLKHTIVKAGTLTRFHPNYSSHSTTACSGLWS